MIQNCKKPSSRGAIGVNRGNHNTLSEIFDKAEMPRSALLISHELSMTGAPLALLEMAKLLDEAGTNVVVACTADGPLRREAEICGIPVDIFPQLFEEGILSEYSNRFEFVVVNTIVSYPAIKELSRGDIPVLWWIHEAEESYLLYEEMLPGELTANITVATVGPSATYILHKYRPLYESSELLYTIPDFSLCSEKIGLDKEANNGIRAFAIIGTLSRRKGQDILLDAINVLDEKEFDKCRFIIVGADVGEPITARVKAATSSEHVSIEYIEHINRDEIPAFYKSVDCLICASRDDPMPMVVIEACMTGKTVICSENTGAAQLLEKYGAGIIYHNNDSDELAANIKKVINGSSNMYDMHKKARTLYEENFIPEIFASNLCSLIDNIRHGTNTETEKKRSQDDTIRGIINDYYAIKKEKTSLKSEMEELRAELELAEKELRYYKDSLLEIENSYFWKLSKPVRHILSAVKGVRREGRSSHRVTEPDE